MTFKDLQKFVDSESGGTTAEANQILRKLRGKPFWYWKDPDYHNQRDRVNKGQCCFNHIIGLPKKNGIEYPMFEYEKQLYRALLEPGFLNSNPKLHTDEPGGNIMYPFKEKHLWVKKSVGLGVSEFFLRLMAWLCLYNDDYLIHRWL